jgi:hypothetical protein
MRKTYSRRNVASERRWEMKTTLLMGDPSGRPLKVVQPYEGADHANVPKAQCPHCKQEPLQVQGTGKRIKSHDTYSAGAICTNLFGLEEDERVFSMGVKIY